LSHLIPLITTATQAKAQLQQIAEYKAQQKTYGPQQPIGGGGRLSLTGINIAFSQKGFVKVGFSSSSR
jgi:hypothetical protein